ncbi:MAG: RNA-directed DNA polymerase [Patescibacteria group bacterium]
MIKSDFIKVCSEQKFWQWVNKQSSVPYKKVANKKAFLEEVFGKISSRNYYPKPPEEYITINKGNGVVRIVPSFRLDDLCVYYYCVRRLEKYIAINHTPGTYGGFGLRGKLRRLEEDEIKEIKDSYEIVEFDNDKFVFTDDGYSVSNLNPNAWFAEWNDFSKKLYFNCANVKYGYATELDISNFYDSIQLDNLEFKLRKYIKNKDNEIVYLLMHFLRFWNRHINFYRQQGAGIPQDTFGECSRIIANFYLQEYDKNIARYCVKKGAMYFRYADDQIIFTLNKKDALRIISKASSLLMREGLNFNQKKVNIMETEQFKKYFCFENFLVLCKNGKSINTKVVNEQIIFYLTHGHELRKQGLSLLKRIINVIGEMSDIPPAVNRLKGLIISDDFLYKTPLKPTEFKKIYSILDQAEKEKFISLLDQEISDCLYSDRLYNILGFYKSIKKPIKNILLSIEMAKKFYNLNR